ncbi:MAG: LON peptidase substrate-binding domain-containing protein [Phycisphaerales bacterium JB043]
MSQPTETIQVNFGNPMPIFPLSGVVLLPHSVLPLHIFEERYCQMVGDVLDGSGQIAMAVPEDGAMKDVHGRVAVRPAVCIGQVAQHEVLADGRYNLLVRGVCRARIVEEEDPEEGRLYRAVQLEPIECPPPSAEDLETTEMMALRSRLDDLFEEGESLDALAIAPNIREHLRGDELPTVAILELLGITAVSDIATKYRLLEEGDPGQRGEIIESELRTLDRLLRKATSQIDPGAPKGVTWN